MRDKHKHWYLAGFAKGARLPLAQVKAEIRFFTRYPWTSNWERGYIDALVSGLGA